MLRGIGRNRILLCFQQLSSAGIRDGTLSDLRPPKCPRFARTTFGAVPRVCPRPDHFKLLSTREANLDHAGYSRGTLALLRAEACLCGRRSIKFLSAVRASDVFSFAALDSYGRRIGIAVYDILEALFLARRLQGNERMKANIDVFASRNPTYPSVVFGKLSAAKIDGNRKTEIETHLSHGVEENFIRIHEGNFARKISSFFYPAQANVALSVDKCRYVCGLLFVCCYHHKWPRCYPLNWKTVT